MRGPSLECPWTLVSEANSTAATRYYRITRRHRGKYAHAPCTPLRHTPRRTGRRRRRQEPRPARRSGHLRALALSGLGALALVGRLTLTCGSADLRVTEGRQARRRIKTDLSGTALSGTGISGMRLDGTGRPEHKPALGDWFDRSTFLQAEARRARTCATAAGSSRGTGRRHSASLPKLHRGSWKGV